MTCWSGCLVCAELLGGSLRLGVELGPDYGDRERSAPGLVSEPGAFAHVSKDRQPGSGVEVGRITPISILTLKLNTLLSGIFRHTAVGEHRCRSISYGCRRRVAAARCPAWDLSSALSSSPQYGSGCGYPEDADGSRNRGGLPGPDRRPAPAASDAAGLRALHRAHQLTVPFENLSIHLAEPISLDERDLIDKIVRRRRGGFCYELNGAFALLLEALGAQVSRVAARVYGEGRPGPAVRPSGADRAPGRRQRALARRRGLRQSQRLSAAARRRDDQDDPAGRFRLADAERGDIDVLKDGEPQYRLETRERSLADFVPTCWWQQTSPLSHFTRSTICSRLTPDGRVSISGRTLIPTQGGTRTEQQLHTDDALLAAYRDHFGIVLSRVPDDPAA